MFISVSFSESMLFARRNLLLKVYEWFITVSCNVFSIHVRTSWSVYCRGYTVGVSFWYKTTSYSFQEATEVYICLKTAGNWSFKHHIHIVSRELYTLPQMTCLFHHVALSCFLLLLPKAAQKLHASLQRIRFQKRTASHTQKHWSDRFVCLSAVNTPAITSSLLKHYWYEDLFFPSHSHRLLISTAEIPYLSSPTSSSLHTSGLVQEAAGGR